jgi:hypothetical protein
MVNINETQEFITVQYDLLMQFILQQDILKFEVLTAVKIQVQVFWVVML